MTSNHSRTAHGIDIRTTRPRLRDGLRFIPQVSRDHTPWFRIEDELCGRFHRIGVAEYEFLLALDGHRTLEQARKQAALSTNHRNVIDAEQSESLVLWAAGEFLVEGHADFHQTSRQGNRSSIAWIKIPLVRGDATWDTLVKATGWLFQTQIAIASVMLWIIAFCLVILNRQRFVDDVATVMSPSGWLTLAGVWLTLKVVHEFGHLVCCQRYGGRVGEVGVAWMLLAPVAYADLTDLYRMKSRAGRLLTCLAGVFIELHVAALAVFAWACTSSPTASHVLATIAVTASLGSMLFNLNPLMRLDGYHALSDWLGRPNLGAEGAKAIKGVAAVIFLGRNRAPRSNSGRLALYGLAVFLYRIFITGSLVVATQAMYGRIGLLIVASIIVIMAAPAFVGWLTAGYREFRSRPAVLVRFLSTSLILAISLGAAWQTIACWQSGWCGIVEYEDDSPLRCASSGKVIRVLVKSGETVNAGDMLVELENLSLCSELMKAQCELAAGEAKWTRLRETHLSAPAASEQKVNDAMKVRVDHLKRQVEHLMVRAPRDGMVIALQPDRWVGQWFEEGEALLYVVDPIKKKVIVAVPQEAMNRVRGLPGSHAQCRSPDGWSLSGTVTSITQQAELEPPHPALAASAGGPLPVRFGNTPDKVSLLSPHVRLEMAISDSDNRWSPGQPVRMIEE